MTQTPQWPSDEDGLRLHAALFSNDPTAPAAFAEAFYGPLCTYLANTYRYVAEDLRVSVASDLVVLLVQKPGSYNPDKLPVVGFLRMAARNKLSTATERDGRRKAREISLDSVAERTASGNVLVESDGPSLSDPRLAAEIASFNQTEKIVLELILDDTRETEVFARALGLDPKHAETAPAVKRLKDTIKARLRRAVGGR